MLELLSEHVLPPLIQMLGVLLCALSGYALRLLLRKFKIQLDDVVETSLRASVRGASRGAEEWAARELKVGRPKPLSEDKMDFAKNLVRQRWPDAVPGELERLIDEEIAALNGVGATGDSIGTERKE